MNQKNQVRRQLKNIFSQKQNRVSAVIGVLGDGSGNVKDTTRVNHVFARISGIVTSVFNVRVPPENDLKVWIGKDAALQSSPTQVLSTYSSSPGGTTGGGVTGYAPASQYEWLGPDPIFIDKRLWIPRRISSYLGLSVKVSQDFFWTGSEFIALAEQIIDLSSYAPTTTGKSKYVMITLDTTGAVVLTASSEIDTVSALPSDLTAVPSGTSDVLAIVRRSYGQIEIQEGPTNFDILDLRFTFYSAGSSGAMAFTDLIDAFADYTGLGGQFVKIKSSEDGLETGIPNGGIIDYGDTNCSNPPTQEDISNAFGAPYTKGQGYLGLLDDAGLGLRQYLCLSDGSKWLFAPFSAAASELGYASLTRYGTLLTGTAGEEYYIAEPSVMIEGGLWKMWYRYGWNNPRIAYATSPDGVTWTRYAGNPVISTALYGPCVFKGGGTYHLYAVPTTWDRFNHYTSPDGVTWTLAQAGVLTVGSSGAWDDDSVGNCFVWIEGANDWRMLYEAKGAPAGAFKIGYATSTDGDTWTKSGSNPVINETGSVGNPFVIKNGSTYYLWAHRTTSGQLPTDIGLYHSTDLISWAFDGLKLQRTGADEGAGSSVGQVADLAICIHNHVMYLFYHASPDGSQAPTGAGPTLKLATASEGVAYGN